MRQSCRRICAAVLVAAACSASCARHQTATVWRAGTFPAGVFIDDVAFLDAPAGWIAVGWTAGSDGQPDTGCFTSPTGRAWMPCRLGPVDTDGRHSRLLNVARLGSTVIAGGIAVGALHGNPRPYMWAAPLGGGTLQELKELNLPRELFGGERIISYNGLTAGPLGGIGVGTWDGPTNQSVAQVWRTADGEDWRRLDGITSLTGSAAEILRGAAVAAGAHRVVLVGAAFDLRRLSNRDDGAVWWSDDGTGWTRADLAGAAMVGPGDQELRVVHSRAGTDGFTAAGSDGDRAAIWSSPDGRSWQPAARLPGGRGSGATITALASVKQRQWAAGVVAGAPRLWTSADGRRWTPVGLPARPPVGTVGAVALATGAGQLMVVVQGSRGSVTALASQERS